MIYVRCLKLEAKKEKFIALIQGILNSAVEYKAVLTKSLKKNIVKDWANKTKKTVCGSDIFLN
jgi:hypothetical protein